MHRMGAQVHGLGANEPTCTPPPPPRHHCVSVCVEGGGGGEGGGGAVQIFIDRHCFANHNGLS